MMAPMTAWEALIAHLRQPEYLHVLLNPLPIYGLSIGLFALVLALFLNERKASWVALAIVFVCALSAWPVAELGEAGYDRVLAMADQAGDAWLDEHMERAGKVLWVFYTVAGIALVAAVVPLKWPRSARPLLMATLIGTAAAVGCGGWIGYAGGQVRHTEFRYGPAPTPEPHEHGG